MGSGTNELEKESLFLQYLELVIAKGCIPKGQTDPLRDCASFTAHLGEAKLLTRDVTSLHHKELPHVAN